MSGDNGRETALQAGGQQTSVMPQMDYMAQLETIKAQKAARDKLVKDVLVEGIHYGTTPGCGDKPSLKKPGAEVLMELFRLTHKFVTTIDELGNGHREYTTICNMYYQDNYVGNASGSCSTLESKYRYRYIERTGQKVAEVPKEYWDARKKAKEEKDETAKKSQEDIMKSISKGHPTQKIEGNWYFVEAAEKEKKENEDIANEYNTVRKICEKRAFVAAVLFTTKSSDKFTQDMDEADAKEEARNVAAKAAEQEKQSSAAAATAGTKEKPKEEKKAAEPEPSSVKDEENQEDTELTCKIEAVETNSYINTKWRFTLINNSKGIKFIGVDKAKTGPNALVGAILCFHGIKETVKNGKTYYNADSAEQVA